MFWSIVLFLIFFLCYLGQSVASGLPQKRGWSLQWACWIIACATMLICYWVV